ncbi:hypothetical protein KHP62_15640 [Rhodobacteraceae bacterium NNCM2]|nr:hypothetical protein [Coraliihabitans acroporae]
MRLARTLRFDISDTQIFERAAEPDEWAISGAFEFSNWDEAELTGKKRQAFANGWLGLETFGRSTFVAVAEITEAEFSAATSALAHHFVDHYGAPDVEAAMPVALEEMTFMSEMCADHDANTLLVVERKLVDAGVSEAFRAIQPQEAAIDLVAIHGTLDE